MIKSAVGIGVGINPLVALGNREKTKPPKLQSEHKLAKEQRKLSRKQKGSHNRNRQMVKMAKVHRHVRQQRMDFHQKLSRKFVAQYDFMPVRGPAQDTPMTQEAPGVSME